MAPSPKGKLEENIELVGFVYTCKVDGELVMVFEDPRSANAFLHTYFKGHSCVVLPVEIFKWVGSE